MWKHSGLQFWGLSPGGINNISSQSPLSSALSIELGPSVVVAFGAKTESAFGHYGPRKGEGKQHQEKVGGLLSPWIMVIA